VRQCRHQLRQWASEVPKAHEMRRAEAEGREGVHGVWNVDTEFD